MFVNEYKHGIFGPARKCDIILQSGDHVNIEYTDPHGKKYTLTVDAQHLVLMVVEKESQASMIFRPSVGVWFTPPVDSGHA